MLKRLQNWLQHNRNFLTSWYGKDEQEIQEPERSLIELPSEIQQELIAAVTELPINLAEKKAVTHAIENSFARWQKNPNNANNSIVILSSPITSVSRILSETLTEWVAETRLDAEFLPLTARPYAIADIKTNLKQYLEKSPRENDNSEKPEIIIIPNLSWYFLRSLEGLEGIEYLQSLWCNESKNRFWIIGADRVGWEYLNYVCALEAYCGEIFTLPQIPAEDLQAWLDPIVERLNIRFDKVNLEVPILSEKEDKDRDRQGEYFKQLANISQGVSTVAVRGFLKSIKYEKNDDDSDETPLEYLIAQTPKLPKLPNLEPTDRYLLYSFLLHGELTISALAESLGDSPAEVQARVQFLRRQGIIERQKNILNINPLYYSKIKKELALNNFVIEKE